MNLERRKFLKILLLAGAVLVASRIIKLEKVPLIGNKRVLTGERPIKQVGGGKARLTHRGEKIDMTDGEQELAFIDKESGEKILVLEK